MGFFKKEHKKFAECSNKALAEGYHASEMKLRKAVATGDEKAMRKAMETHQKYEYALLYKCTPEYRAKQKIDYTYIGRASEQNNKGRK